MKRISNPENKIFQNTKRTLFLILAVLSLSLSGVIAQDTETEKQEEEEKLERPAFESATLIDNPTNVLFPKNTLEVVMVHRFGLIDGGGTNDLAGIWDPSNIRIGVSYAVHERVTVGFGTTRFDRLQDFNLKLALLRQTRSNKMPVSISYFGNFTIDARGKVPYSLKQHRYSFFNQLIIAKRFSPNFSFQVAPSVSHYNLVDKTMTNDVFSVALGGRYKVSPQTAILIDYSQPITTFDMGTPEPGFSVAIEFATSAHTFQLILSNYNGIVPQKNYIFNQNNFFDGDMLLGFNITRNYNF